MKKVLLLEFSAPLVLFFILTCALAITIKRAQAATIYLEPSSAKVATDSTFPISVKLDTQGKNINASEATVVFDAAALQIIDVQPGILFYLLSPGAPQKTDKSIFFSASIPKGFNGADGLIGTITFKAKTLGQTTINIQSGKALLNDGHATEALSATYGAKINVIASSLEALVVASRTQPDPNGWYSNNQVSLYWNRPNGAYSFYYVLDHQPDTIPSQSQVIYKTTKDFTALDDGIWYFHIRSAGQGGDSLFSSTEHFKIQIDTQPPNPFEVALIGQNDLKKVSSSPEVAFAATDDMSGIARYTLEMDGKEQQSDTPSPYYFSRLATGPHVIKITAYDKAGNSIAASMPIIVSGSWFYNLARSANVPIYWLVLINLVLLLAIYLFIKYILIRRLALSRISSKAYNQISKIKSGLQKKMEDLRQQTDIELEKVDGSDEKELLKQKLDQEIQSIEKKIDQTVDHFHKDDK